MNLRNSAVLCATVLAVACSGEDLAERQAEVEQAGSLVMPFDLERTTHVFEARASGGLQTVVADDHDPEQVGLIRAHLAEEAERFAKGDFHDPAMIHGDDMAGMHTLVTRHEELTISYREVEGGAEIEYTAREPELIDAIHVWFRAQLRDHGEHAQAHR